MKLQHRWCAMLLCFVLALGMCAQTSAEGTAAGTKLPLPEGANILSLSADGDYIAVAYEKDATDYAAVFTAEGMPIGEPYQSADGLFVRFLDSGALAVGNADALDVWDVQKNEKLCTYELSKGAIPDADGQAVWQTETTEKNNEVDQPTTYITKAIRTSADGTQSVRELPEHTTALLYAQYPYLYYKKEMPEYKRIICRMNAETGEDEELSDWVRGADTPMGHLSKLFQSEILMPWEAPEQMLVVHQAQMIARDGTTLLLQGEADVSVIDAQRQTLLMQAPLDGEIIAGAVSAENHYCVLADASSATVYRWQGEGAPTDMAQAIDRANLADAIRAQREALLTMYGVTVSEDADMVTESVQPKALESELRAYVAGIELTNFFALLPEGFVDEMRPAAVSTLPVYLTGYMTCVGLSIPYDEIFYLALDVNFLYGSFIFYDPVEEETSPMLDTLPHEFMHMLEYRMQQTTLPDGAPLLSLWDTVVPPEEDESFTGTYEGDWDVRNSLESDDPAEEIWFEAAYSRTMPEEDRSTLFACLFSGVHDTGEGWDAYPHLLEKGQLLCALIREAYPSVQATPEGSMYWERNFEPRPLSSFLPQK